MKGFTLIELIAVLVVVGVLAATAAVRFTGTSTISLRGAADMIQADIRYAQELAMAEHTAKSVEFTSGDDFYTVDAETQDLSDLGVTIANTFTVTFNSLGEPTFLPEDEDSVKISAGGQDKTITVSEYTGKVSIN